MSKTKLEQNWRRALCACPEQNMKQFGTNEVHRAGVSKNLRYSLSLIDIKICTCLHSCIMNKKTSHKAKTSSDWIRRLRLFAAGQKFDRGEKPPSGSRWHAVIKRIESCPAHNTAGILCVCHYHQPAVSFSPFHCVCVFHFIST